MPDNFLNIFILCYSDIVLFYIYISARLHGLYNAFFSAFYSKQLNNMIYFYLYVFGRNNSNPSFHEKRLPVIAACRGFGWKFSTHRQAVYDWKLSGKKKKKQLKHRSIPSENHSFCVESIVFSINQPTNWINPFSLRSFFSDHTADKKPRWNWIRDWSIPWKCPWG